MRFPYAVKEKNMDKSYTEQQQIGYFEVDNNLCLTPAALVFHLQDTAIRHSASKKSCSNKVVVSLS